MSHELINRSPDLTKLRDEGYDVEVIDGYLVVNDVPYVNSKREVKRGRLISELTLSADLTTRPHTHVMMFAGEMPCHKNGSEIEQIKHGSGTRRLGESLTVNFSFSNKPPAGYADYHEKVSTYVRIISGPAASIDPTATAQTFAMPVQPALDAVFAYTDTASTRAGVSEITAKLALDSVAIVGLGGTGAYVLDLVSKTPVKSILLIDGDRFSQHNAFRSPGAATIEDVGCGQSKAEYFQTKYSALHRNIVAHAEFLNESNIEIIADASFVFVCVDNGSAKRMMFDYLERRDVPFIDVGMGILAENETLGGIIRVTVSTSAQRRHIYDRQLIDFSDATVDNDYHQNIQIADLNALNAALAVIKWKKLFGFYRDFGLEHHLTYSIDTNSLISDA